MSTALDLIEPTMSDGTPLDWWQRAVIEEWCRRHPEPRVLTFGKGKGQLTVNMVPRGVYCARCRTPSVLFPGDPEINEVENNKGYCICPKCSMPKTNVVAL